MKNFHTGSMNGKRMVIMLLLTFIGATLMAFGAAHLMHLID